MKVELINTTPYVELATTRCRCLILYTCHAIVREVGLNEFKFDEHFIKFKRTCSTAVRVVLNPCFSLYSFVLKNHVTKTGIRMQTLEFRTNNSLLHQVEIDFCLIRASNERNPIYFDL